jgi:hypothetical protein
MLMDGYPITREGFLDCAYLGDPLSEDRIEEDTLPPQFRHGPAENSRECGRRRREPDAACGPR